MWSFACGGRAGRIERQVAHFEVQRLRDSQPCPPLLEHQQLRLPEEPERAGRCSDDGDVTSSASRYYGVHRGLELPLVCASHVWELRRPVFWGNTLWACAGGRRLVWSLLKSLCGGPRCPVAIAKRRRPTNHYASVWRLWNHYI